MRSDTIEAQKSARPEEVIEKIREAVELLKEKGEEGLEILRSPTSRFVWKDCYLFIIDVEKSLVLSNPAFPEREGGNIREHLDWDKNLYGVGLCEKAKHGGGWIEFVWPKPGTDDPLRKIAYVYPVPGYRFTVCAGIYDDEISLEEADRKWRIED
ncbi:MAG: cache domain-containing protein [Candidatus Accumulibacter sp.]|jgi:signal transduction histidine kinase|nr:cache domain-containing protein [Accumulibacter sp.]